MIAFDGLGAKLCFFKGTVFRVFSCPEGEKLYEFRRGFKTNAIIYSMNFNVRTPLCMSADGSVASSRLLVRL